MPKGVRYGGKPLGWRKPEGTRDQKQMRAYPDELELIQRFAKLVKYGDKAACKKFLDSRNNHSKIFHGVAQCGVFFVLSNN